MSRAAADRSEIRRARGPADRLWPHVRFFARQQTPLVIVPLLIGALLLRLLVADLGATDLALVLVIVTCESATEWFLHRFVLHLGPRRLFGRTIELHPSRAHRVHHDDPHDPATVFVGPIGTVVFLAGLAMIAVVALRDGGPRLTLVVTGLAMLLIYEWTHFLIHTAYRPRHSWYRGLWRAHRLHHFRDERNWLGITGHGFDRLVGTFPTSSLSVTEPTAHGIPHPSQTEP